MLVNKKLHVIVFLIMVSVVALGSYLYSTTSYLREIKTYSVTLTEAYSYTLNVGKSNTREAFRGQFYHAPTNLLLNRELDGFQYQRFLDGGKKPLATTLQLSRLDLNEKEPFYAVQGFLFAFMAGLGIFFHGFLIFCGVFDDRYRSFG